MKKLKHREEKLIEKQHEKMNELEAKVKRHIEREEEEVSQAQLNDMMTYDFLF